MKSTNTIDIFKTIFRMLLRYHFDVGMFTNSYSCQTVCTLAARHSFSFDIHPLQYFVRWYKVNYYTTEHKDKENKILSIKENFLKGK